MAGFVLGAQSRARLAGVHPDLVRVVERAIQISPVDFRVIEGVRTLARQKQLLKGGATRTLKSRHLKAPNGWGHAVDLAPLVGGEVRWDWPLFHLLAPAVKAAAKELGVPLEWGGDWKSFRDGPHFQLPARLYPG